MHLYQNIIIINPSIHPSSLLHDILLLTAPLPGCLTSLSDVDQAQQVHQFEEHDHQADDANCLEPLRLPPHTHLSLVFYLFLHGPFFYFPLHYCDFTCSLLSSFLAVSETMSLTNHYFLPVFPQQFLTLYSTLPFYLTEYPVLVPGLIDFPGYFQGITKGNIWWSMVILRSSGSDYCCKKKGRGKKNSPSRKQENLDQQINPWEIQSDRDEAKILLH